MLPSSALIYIHGFSSSPASWKASLMKTAIAKLPLHQIEIPQLPLSPKVAIEQLEQLVERTLAELENQHLTLIGSSLGGYYAIYLAHKYGLKAILINPAVQPYIDLEKYLGKNTNTHTGETFTFTQEHVEELKRYDIETIQRPERFLLMVQTADEVLDYHHAVDKFPHSTQIVQAGGSHGFDEFDQMIPQVLDFAGIIHA